MRGMARFEQGECQDFVQCKPSNCLSFEIDMSVSLPIIYFAHMHHLTHRHYT